MAPFTCTGSELLACCASQRFAEGMLARLKEVYILQELIWVAKQVWWNEVCLPRFARKPRHWRDPFKCCALQVPVSGWLEAFAAHPQIGDTASLRSSHGAFAESSRGEQAAALATADGAALRVWFPPVLLLALTAGLLPVS